MVMFCLLIFWYSSALFYGILVSYMAYNMICNMLGHRRKSDQGDEGEGRIAVERLASCSVPKGSDTGGVPKGSDTGIGVS